MARVVRNRGASGEDSIKFRQNLDYPREPGAITYYPPEPSEELQKQVRKDKGGGIALYIIGFIIAIIGYTVLTENYPAIDRYNVLIPIFLALGLLAAILYLALNNDALAKLSRALPKLLMVALTLLLIISIVQQITDLQFIQPPNEPSDNATPMEWNNYNNSMEQFEIDMGNSIDNLFDSIVNPGFFIMTAGLFACIAGGTMLWTSTKIVNQYIPGMIVLETPNMGVASQTPSQSPAEAIPEEEYVDAEPDSSKLCQNCSQPMTFIEQYDRHYCYDCETYGEKEEPSE